jgi:hypothetical protein
LTSNGRDEARLTGWGGFDARGQRRLHWLTRCFAYHQSASETTRISSAFGSQETSMIRSDRRANWSIEPGEGAIVTPNGLMLADLSAP